MASGTYSYSDLRKLWISAGGSRAWSFVMAAVAMAESGGNPSAHHVDSNGSVDYGLWQINSIHGYSPQSSYNPLQNAKQAVAVFKSSGAHAWSTYTSGAYKQYMPSNQSVPSSSNSFGIYTPGDYAGVDQGVDFRGKGPIPALGNALITDVGKTRIVETGNKEWNYIIYLLRTGPYKGHYVYVAENLTPEVHRGQIVQEGQEIAQAPGGYPFTETGFNRSAQGWSAFGNLNGPQPAGKAMKDFIYSLIGKGSKVTVASAGAGGVTTGGATPNKIISDVTGGWAAGIESLIMQGFFILIGVLLVVTGLALVAWAVLQRTGAPGVVGMAQTQMRIKQSGLRTAESQRASQVRESQAGQRIQGQTASRELSRERLDVQRQNLGRRSERYVVKDKPNQVVRKPGKRVGGVPRKA